MKKILIIFLLFKNIFCGQIISVPGTYVFGGNITYTPTAPGDQVIHITSNNVTINLSASTLMQDSNAMLAAVDGILIDAGLQNISIIKGTINGFTGAGIRVSDG